MDAVINGVPVLVLILGLVEFLKHMGVEGKASIVASMVLGVVFGVLYQVSVGMPVGVGEWVGAVVYGLALGLSSSGLYDLGKRYFSI